VLLLAPALPGGGTHRARVSWSEVETLAWRIHPAPVHDAVPLPPRVESEPDADGIKTVVEYRRTMDGRVEKHTLKIKVSETKTRTSAAAVERMVSVPDLCCASLWCNICLCRLE
jgi:hypothetical protein